MVARTRSLRRRRMAAAILGTLGAVVLACAWDLRALAIRAAAPPHDFHGQGCAGVPEGGAPASSAGAQGVWAAFDGVSSHEAVLPGTLAASWRFTTRGSVVAAPAVVDGTAYAGSMDGCVYAIDVATGQLRWSFAAGNQIMSEPLVVDGVVYVGSGDKQMARTRSGRMVRGSGSSGIYALDARTGALLWMHPTLGEDMATPVYQGGVLYEASGDQTFFALDAATGALMWSVPVGSYDSMSSPVLSGDIAVFGGAAPYALYGVNVAAHRVAWTLPLPSAYSGVDDGSPAVAGGVAYVQVPTGRLVPTIWELAVRTSDGKLLWRRRLGDDPWNLLGRALGMGNLDARGGEQVGVATVAGGVVYVGTPALHRLWALRASDGAPAWPHPASVSEAVRSAPVVDGGRIYAAGDTRLYTLTLGGTLLWSRPLGTRRAETGILVPCAAPGPEVVGQTLLVGAGLNGRAVEALPISAA